MATSTLERFATATPDAGDVHVITVPVIQTERVLSPVALGHLREIAAAGVDLDRSSFDDEWPRLSDEEYASIYAD